MAEIANAGGDREPLAALEDLGRGAAFADQIFSLVGRSQFFAEFNRDDVDLLAGYMRIYHAEPGQVIIREGDIGDKLSALSQFWMSSAYSQTAVMLARN